MQYDHNGIRLDHEHPVDLDIHDAIHALDELVYDYGAHFAINDDSRTVQQYHSAVAAACHDYLAAYYRPCTGWHAADERAYTHDRTTHPSHRPG